MTILPVITERMVRIGLISDILFLSVYLDHMTGKVSPISLRTKILDATF